MSNNLTTLSYRSNLYPVGSNVREDRVFLSKVHDPFSLETMKKNGLQLTAIQQKEYNYASLHCSFAFKDDFPWGTVTGPDGKPSVVCRCTNVRCNLFGECRPDFDESELAVYEENKIARPEIFSRINWVEEPQTENDESRNAAEKLFSDPEEQIDPQVDEENPQKRDFIDEKDDLFIAMHREESSPAAVETPDISFASFAETSQDVIIEAEPTERIIVNAGPGTGKTWTLIEKIIYMIGEQGISPSNILVLCFSRAAVAVIKNRLSSAASEGRIDYAWRDVDIRTFDSFATYMLSWVQQELPELLPDGFVLEANNYEQRILQAKRILELKKDILSEYEQIIVDEVQDLVGNRADMVLSLLAGLPETCGFTLLGDSCQSLYDYLASDDPTVTSSVEFYNELFQTYPFARYCAMTVNHRQGDDLGSSTIPYRNAILNGNRNTRSEQASDLFANIPSAGCRLQQFSKEEAGEYLRGGTLGILTRTNGQALQISAWLRNEDIPHGLQRGIGTAGLGDWISKVFCGYENETVDESAFIARHMTVFAGSDYDTAKERWYSLVNTMSRDAVKPRHEVKDLLFGLIRNSREPELYKSDGEKNYAITVSNIHRAKGCEFDSVIVIDDVIKSLAEPENDDILEHKVCYVALTRPKKRIEHVDLPTQYIYVARNASRRCSKASKRPGRKPYISHFEVGADDLDILSLAETAERQDFIRNNLRSGMRLRLKKCPQGTRPYVTYSVTVEDQEHIVLGYTGRLFAEELNAAMQRIFKITSSVSYDVFPHAFVDVYVGNVTSHISSGVMPPGARVFGDVAVWSGMTITGFAAVDRDTY